MTKHTIGPWDLHESGAIVGPALDAERNYLRPFVARFEGEITVADARLMAAAPELLALANEVSRAKDARLASMAAAVINKATAGV